MIENIINNSITLEGSPENRSQVETVFSCLKEITELSLKWSVIGFIDVKKISPSNKVLCWCQDFPNPSIDIVNLISQKISIKSPKDAMIIRNKFTKFSKQEKYKNDPFFLMRFLLHIRSYHATVDDRLKQFIDLTKKMIHDVELIVQLILLIRVLVLFAHVITLITKNTIY